MNQKSSSVGQVNIWWSWRGWGKADACQSGGMSQHVPRPADSSTLPHELGRETVEAEMPGQQTSPPECYSSVWLKSSCSEAVSCISANVNIEQSQNALPSQKSRRSYLVTFCRGSEKHSKGHPKAGTSTSWREKEDQAWDNQRGLLDPKTAWTWLSLL